MKEYVKPQMDIVELEGEEIVLASGCPSPIGESGYI